MLAFGLVFTQRSSKTQLSLIKKIITVRQGSKDAFEIQAAILLYSMRPKQ